MAVLAIPYLRAGDLPIIAQDSEELGSPVVKATRRLYVEAVNAARRRSGNKPLVVTGHLHCSGAIESEGAERRILVGGEHAVPPDIFANDIAYVALGHARRCEDHFNSHKSVLVPVLLRLAATETTKSRPSRDFRGRSIFDFFNSIDPERTIGSIRPGSAVI
jgi:hypothetical protein